MSGAADASLVIEGLVAGYAGRRVLDHVTLPPLAAGTVTMLVGPNGAGKSTLLRSVARLLPAEGTAWLGAVDLLRMPPRAHAATVAFMPQSLPQGVHLTVFEALLSAMNASADSAVFGASRESQERVVALLDRVGIRDYAHRPLDELSGGERQLASLAQTLVRDPRVLLLDEPTSALDLRHQVSVMSLVRSLADEGRIVIVVAHDLNLAARWAEALVVLRGGRLVAAGTPADALTPAVLAEAYGVSARVEHCSRGQAHVLVDGLVDSERMEEASWAATR
ncbi:MAG: ABC transporter ATP-binding protein [Acidobacteria bacterium]|nr:ABC transporter ATP-binding protein [Acidobacteriota bacterium]